MAKLVGQIEGHQDILFKLSADLKSQKLPSCLLFSGPIGIGKRLVSQALAQIANCEKKGALACGQCGSCLRIYHNQSESIFELRSNGAPIKIEEARQAIHFFDLRNLNQSRFLIVDDAELLTTQAASSLLKTFEEPPHDSYIILVTAFPWKLLSTIRSRAVKVTFQPLSPSAIRKIVPDAPTWVLNASYGQVGRAHELIRWHHQGFRESAEKILRQVLEPLDLNSEILRSAIPDRDDALIILKLLSSFVRDAIWLHNYKNPQGLINLDRLNWLKEFASTYPFDLTQLFFSIQNLDSKVRHHADLTLSFESFFIEVTNGSY